MSDPVTIYVSWSAEFGDGEPPANYQQVPQSIYDNGMTNMDGVDEVAEWLTDNYDFLVKDWMLCPEYNCD